MGRYIDLTRLNVRVWTVTALTLTTELLIGLTVL
jgi:hypothetical protein